MARRLEHEASREKEDLEDLADKLKDAFEVVSSSVRSITETGSEEIDAREGASSGKPGQDVYVHLEALFATNGRDALSQAAEELPDLILLDVDMPGMDGFEVCRQLKADVQTRTIPVIFVTGKGETEDEARGLEVGGIDYLTKPVRPAIVRARVRNHLELKRARDLLERLATLDGLTSIANRRRFDEQLEREWRRAQRNMSEISLIMIDIDFFKQFNDTYGHAQGDDCLRRIAASLESAVLRPADLITRCGGEEFVCLLPETGMSGARDVAERMQSSAAELAIPHGASTISDQVTLSMGATMAPGAGNAAAELVELADARLYRAEKGGRNQIAFD